MAQCGAPADPQDHWYHNLDKIIHYINEKARRGEGKLVAFYSTPSQYADAKRAASVRANLTWETRSDDIFPLANNAHSYWSG